MYIKKINNNNNDDDNNNKLMIDFVVLKMKRLNNKNIYLAISLKNLVLQVYKNVKLL